MKQTLNALKAYFKTGKKPTEQQFADTLDSFRHKDDPIAISEVTGLTSALSTTASVTQVNNLTTTVEELQEELESLDPSELKNQIYREADYILAKQYGVKQIPSVKQLVTLSAGLPQLHGSCIAGKYAFFGVRPLSTMTPASIVRMRLDNIGVYDVLNYTWDQLGAAEQLTYVAEKNVVVVAHNSRFNDLNITKVNPDTLDQELVVNDVAIGYPVRFPTTCTDGTYLYVTIGGASSIGVTCRVRKYLITESGLYPFVAELDTGINASGHAIKYDGIGNLFVTTSYRTTPVQQYILRISTESFTLASQGELIGESYTDDMTIIGNYVYVGMEYIYDTPGALTVARIDRSDLTKVDYFTFPTIVGSTYGVTTDGTYLWICGSTTPGYIIRVDPETLQTAIYETPTGENIPNEILFNKENIFIAYWLNPAKVARYHKIHFQTIGYLKAGTPYVFEAGGGGGGSVGSTDDVTEGTTNLYHTAARVRAAVMTGVSFLVSTAVVATDTLLEAIGKLQGQITSNKTYIQAVDTALAALTTVVGYKQDKRTWQDVTFAAATPIDLSGTGLSKNIQNVTGNQSITHNGGTGLTAGEEVSFIIDKQTGSPIDITLPSSTVIENYLGSTEGTFLTNVVTLKGATGSKYLFKTVQVQGYPITKITKIASDSVINPVGVFYKLPAPIVLSSVSSATGVDTVILEIPVPANTYPIGSAAELLYMFTSGAGGASKTLKIYDKIAGSGGTGLISSAFTTTASQTICNDVLIEFQSGGQLISKKNSTGARQFLTLDWSVDRIIRVAINISNVSEVGSTLESLILKKAGI